MKVHHLNCATLCPYAGRLIGSDVGLFDRGRMICHCLVIESSDGLVLVDTGVGMGAVRDANRHLGRLFTTFMGGGVESETALRRIEALGMSPSDVRHIVVTHLDLDHAGGIPDFPAATVHVHADEHRAAMERRTSNERRRYRTAHWAHGPNWDLLSPGGDRWLGFESVRALPGVEPEVLLVPLHGHTRGHCAVAVRSGDRWLLHCGDAYFWHEEKLIEGARCPIGLAIFQSAMAVDRKARDHNVERIRELVRDHSSDVSVFCAHDTHELAAFD